MLLRTQNEADSSASPVVRMPRFSEVCTRPGISVLMASTPFGAQARKQTHRRVESASMGVRAVSAGSAVRRISGSAARYSFFRAAASSSAAADAARPSETRTRALASRGMALSFSPPSTETSRSSAARLMASSARPISWTAFARPRSIS